MSSAGSPDRGPDVAQGAVFRIRPGLVPSFRPRAVPERSPTCSLMFKRPGGARIFCNFSHGGRVQRGPCALTWGGLLGRAPPGVPRGSPALSPSGSRRRGQGVSSAPLCTLAEPCGLVGTETRTSGPLRVCVLWEKLPLAPRGPRGPTCHRDFVRGGGGWPRPLSIGASLLGALGSAGGSEAAPRPGPPLPPPFFPPTVSLSLSFPPSKPAGLNWEATHFRG